MRRLLERKHLSSCPFYTISWVWQIYVQVSHFTMTMLYELSLALLLNSPMFYWIPQSSIVLHSLWHESSQLHNDWLNSIAFRLESLQLCVANWIVRLYCLLEGSSYCKVECASVPVVLWEVLVIVEWDVLVYLSHVSQCVTSMWKWWLSCDIR